MVMSFDTNKIASYLLWSLLEFISILEAILPKKLCYPIVGYFVRLKMSENNTNYKNLATNVDACFKNYPASDRKKIITECVLNHGIGLLENIRSWHRSDNYIKKSLTISNFAIVENYNNAGLPVIFLLPHFTHMFLALRIISIISPKTFGVRKEQSSRIFENYYAHVLKRNNMLNIFQNEIKKALTVLRSKKNVLILPDADLGMKNSVFADFFGIKAATVTSVSKLARLGGAKVVAVNFYRENNQYMLEFEDLSDHMTLTDFESDATLINKTFEKYIRMHPDQYGWSHKRFKTRPNGEGNFYNN